ncbi:MAG: hypothetical protein ABJC12_12215 [Saprospiraceae bacterium]
MLEFFKKNHLFNSLLLIPYAFIIRIVAILFADARIPGEIFGAWGADFIANVHQWGLGEFFFSTFLVFIQAAMINRLFIRQSMLGEINLFPGLSYILLTSLHPSFIGVSSVLLANTALLIALIYLFDILKKEKQEEIRFMAGWWLAVAGLFYTPYMVLVIFGLIAMSMLKTLKVKDIFQYLTGYFSPFFIGWLVRIILIRQFQPRILHVFDQFGIPSFGNGHGTPDIIVATLLAMLMLFTLLGYSQIIARKNIHAQKKIDTLYALIFFCIPMALFCETLGASFLMVFLIPFSLFLALLLRMLRHPAIAESIHFILFVVALLTQVLILVGSS